MAQPNQVTRMILPALLAATLALPQNVLAARYEVKQGEGTAITFTSKAPLEKFKGHTGQVTGALDADLHDLRNCDLEVTVDLASFDTGNSKRNRHMRENHLETGKYPVARFSAQGVAAGPDSLPVGGEVSLTLQGTLDLHGVARPLTCRVQVRDLGGGRLEVDATFAVKLSDHAIKRPKFLVMKVADEQQVNVRLLLAGGA